MSYVIQTRLWYLRDVDDSPDARLAFHVETGDCFATLATMVGLAEDALRDALARHEPPPTIALMLLQGVREDLMRLYRSYSIKIKKI